VGRADNLRVIVSYGVHCALSLWRSEVV
jgi:hypothetical protein